MTELNSTALVSTKGGTDERGENREEGQQDGQALVVTGSSSLRVPENKGGSVRSSAVAAAATLSSWTSRQRADPPWSPAGSPFDKLPDEIISLIATCYFEGADRYFWPERTLECFLLSKRIYHLAQPAATATHRFDSWSARTRSLIRRPELHRHVKHLFYDDDVEEQPIRGVQSDTLTLSVDFTETLRRLNKLKRLILNLETEFDLADPSFTLSEAMPQLDELELGFCRSLVPYFADPHTSLGRLHINMCNFEEGINLPWPTLQELHMTGCGPDDLHALASTIRAAFAPQSATITPLPLRVFRYNDPILRAPSSHDDAECRAGSTQLLHALGGASIPSLHLKVWSPLDIPDTLPSFPAVAQLTLGTLMVDLSQVSELRQLNKLLKRFPSIVYVQLRGRDFEKPPHIVNPELPEDEPARTDYLQEHRDLQAALIRPTLLTPMGGEDLDEERYRGGMAVPAQVAGGDGRGVLVLEAFVAVLCRDGGRNAFGPSFFAFESGGRGEKHKLGVTI
ncbi:hypothetical protein JCM8547_002982 [Rhodosporidiobolus lusitaniae]